LLCSRWSFNARSAIAANPARGQFAAATAHRHHHVATTGRDVWQFLEQAWFAHHRGGVMPSLLPDP
jgi:hypothetical protein